MKQVPAHLQKYIDYIRNTGHVPLENAKFDDDWEPIGPMVRAELKKHRLIEEWGGALAVELDVT